MILTGHDFLLIAGNAALWFAIYYLCKLGDWLKDRRR